MFYYISNNYEQYSGPFAIDQLIANGLKRDSLVWRDGFTAWLPAWQVQELAGIIGNTPPPLEITLQNVQVPKRAPAVSKVRTAQKAPAISKESIAKKPTAAKKEQTSKKPTTAAKTKKNKGKRSYPVASWLPEAVALLIFIAIHASMALAGWTIWEYIYLDALGAVLCIIAIAIGAKIKALNKVSYENGSASRFQAERRSKFNGFFVSTLAAIGFLIILVQSAHYVYVS